MFKCVKTTVKYVKNNRNFSQLMIDIRNNRWKHWDAFLNDHCLHCNRNLSTKQELQTFWVECTDLIQSFDVILHLES